MAFKMTNSILIFFSDHFIFITIVDCFSQRIKNAFDVSLINTSLSWVLNPKIFKVVIVLQINFHRALTDYLLSKLHRKNIWTNIGLKEAKVVSFKVFIDVPLRHNEITSESLTFLASGEKILFYLEIISQVIHYSQLKLLYELKWSLNRFYFVL